MNTKNLFECTARCWYVLLPVLCKLIECFAYELVNGTTYRKISANKSHESKKKRLEFTSPKPQTCIAYIAKPQQTFQ